MKERIRAWLRETHSSLFELFRHFLAQFFESDPAGSGGWLKLCLGVVGLLPITWPILFLAWQAKYIALLQRPPASAFRAAVREDELWLIAAAMCITAVLTSIQWQALFPSRRDLLALNSLPLGTGEIFLAKFGALLAIFTVFVLALTVIPSYSFAVIVAGRWQENQSSIDNTIGLAAAGMGACAFVFFGLVGLQGILLNLLPARWFARISVYIQGSLFTLSLAAAPYLDRPAAWWWPPKWFLDVWAAMTGVPGDGAGRAVAAVTASLVTAIGCYLLSYRRYQRVLLEELAEKAVHKPKRNRIRAALMDWWIQDPREQAVFVFLWKTLARSRNHRLLLLGYAGAGLGWILRDTAAWQGARPTQEGLAIPMMWTALTLSTFVMAGLRYLSSVPVDVGANWAFRITEREGRTAWLRALERFVMCCGMGPILLIAFPAIAAEIGWIRGAEALTLGLLLELMLFELFFQSWQKAPFACSLLAAKRPLLVAILPYVVLLLLLVPASAIVIYSSAYAPRWAAVGGVGVLFWWKLRRERMRIWSETPLQFEDAAEEVQTLGLGARCASHLEEDGSAPPATQPRAQPIFTGSLLRAPGASPVKELEEILQERDRRHGVSMWARTALEDARFGLRLARQSPALSAAVVLTMAVGIGMNSTVFTVLSATALRPAVYKHPADFLMVFPYDAASGGAMAATYDEYLAFARARTLAALAASSRTEISLGENDRRPAAGMLVSCNWFAVQGLARARQGRLFSPDDCAAAGAAQAVILNEQTWRDRFGGDERLVGRTIHIDGLPFTVAGVAPGAGWSDQTDAWLPYTAQPQLDAARNNFSPGGRRWLELAGRLAPGRSRAAAEAELSAIAQQVRPAAKSAALVTDGSWIHTPGFTMSALSGMVLVMTALTLVLLTACANAATLLLSRAASRQRELAVRLSLGAGRSRILRMLLTEGLLLAAAAGAISMWVAYYSPGVLYGFLAKRAPTFRMVPDWRVFLYTAIVVAAMGFLSGVAPAIESLRADLTESLKGHARFSPSGSRSGRVRSFLVGAQVAFSLALLVAAGGFGKAQYAIFGTAPGYQTRRVLAVPINFSRRMHPAAMSQMQRDIASTVGTLPGVRSIAYANNLPISGHNTVDVRLPGAQTVYAISVQGVSPAYFETLGIPILSGCEFQQPDVDLLAAGEPGGSTAPPVVKVVVSDSLARTFWPNQDAVGKRLQMDSLASSRFTSRGVLEVLGVARGIHPGGNGSAVPAAWWLNRQNPVRSYLLARVDGPVRETAERIRTAGAKIAPELALAPRPLQAFLDDASNQLWNVAALAGVLGITALLLAVTGIYASARYAVAQRKQEMGVRMALGAQPSDIVREVIIAGGKPVMVGMLAGLWIAMALTGALRSALAGAVHLDTSDPRVYAAAAVLLVCSALAAIVGPARRCAASDPLDSLRAE